MTQETKDMIVLLQLEFSAEIEQADHDPKYSYRIFQRKTGNPIYQACRFSDMFRFFNIGPSMKIEDIDIRIQWGRKIVMPAMIDTPRIRERSRLKLVRFYIESGYGPEGIAQYKNQLFETEIRKIFSDLGFEITRKTPEYNYQQRYAGFNPNSSESYIIFEFLQDKNMEKSVKLATLIQKQFKTSARRIDKGVHQAGFLVLRETSMPGVLVELGYISTPDEEQYLLSDTGSEALANSIYKAFLNYKREHDAPIDRSKVQQPEVPELEESVAETPTDEPDSAPEPVRSNRKPDTPNIKTNKSNPEVVHKPIFKIQILASDRILPKNSRQLKGLSPVSYYKEKGLYKYTYGESTDYNKVLRMKREVTAKFKDAFIIAFKNGEKMNVNEAIKEFKKNR